jgi:hypothetical protein
MLQEKHLSFRDKRFFASFWLNVFCFLSSLSLLHPDTTAVFGFYLTHLSTLNQHCFAGTGLPNHMMGEVSWDPKRRQSWAY